MVRIVFGVFLGLHGMVHILYLGHSIRIFELKSGMVWPDESWAFSSFLGEARTRYLASVSCGLAAAGTAAGSIGVLARQTWWQPLTVVSLAFSSVIFTLLWDGRVQKLDDQGGIGLLINLLILLIIFTFL